MKSLTRPAPGTPRPTAGGKVRRRTKKPPANQGTWTAGGRMMSALGTVAILGAALCGPAAAVLALVLFRGAATRAVAGSHLLRAGG